MDRPGLMGETSDFSTREYVRNIYELTVPFCIYQRISFLFPIRRRKFTVVLEEPQHITCVENTKILLMR